MPNFNTVVLAGHLTRDPELRYTPQGAAVCDFTIAINRKFTKKDGEKGEEVAFVDVTSWNRQAEIAAEYLKKGRPVLVSGRIVQDRWEDKDTGQKRSKLRVVAGSLHFLGTGSKDAEAPLAESAPEEPLVVPDTDPIPAAPQPKPLAQKGRNPVKR
jgi:single-strand DNA-binding protein